MGSKTLIVNELLAFLQHQQDVMDEVSVMQLCTSKYTENEIRIAKTLLYESLDMADRMPSRRRDEKGERSLQDIIQVLKETDPDDVPTFVAKRLLSVTLDHVDVTSLLKDINTLKASMAEMEFKLNASQNTIGELRADIVDLRNTVAVCRSPEYGSKVNTRRGAYNTTQSSFESAKLESSPAAVTASDALPRPACPASSAVETTLQVSASTPRRAYSAAAAQPPIQKEQQKQQTESKSHSKPAQSNVPAVQRKEHADKEGFVTVEKKRRKPACRNQCGTGLTGPNMLLRPAIPSTQLYVSRLHYSTKVEEIVEYIRIKTKWNLRVEMLESRHNVNFKSFVVRFPTQHQDIFMKEDFWPKGVVYRRFRGRLRDTTQRNTTPSSLRV